MNEAKRLQLITEAVRYCQHVRALGMPSQCYSKTLREPVFFLWELRAGSKETASKYRSRNAVGLSFGSADLIYDHAVPFRLLKAELLELDPTTPETVGQVLDRHGVTVLITKAEDRLLRERGCNHHMPEDWDGSDPVARYTAVGIDLVPNDVA